MAMDLDRESLDALEELLVAVSIRPDLRVAVEMAPNLIYQDDPFVIPAWGMAHAASYGAWIEA